MNKKIKIALLGYGKMGHEIEKLALEKGHEIVIKLDHMNMDSFDWDELTKADVAIEFTQPEAAVDNIIKCFNADVPVVCGTTGWLSRYEEVENICRKENRGFFYASNYSLGVNLFFELNRKLAEMMRPYNQFDLKVTEIHHTQKLDSPSGTAISIAQDLLKKTGNRKEWVNQLVAAPSDIKKVEKDQLLIVSLREEGVPGTHTVEYTSDVDSIEITHTAFSRKGFAAGALMAAEWMSGKKGVYSMKDLLNL